MIWTFSGRRVEFEDRKRGQTYYFEPLEHSLEQKIQMSAEFDEDPHTLQNRWSIGHQLEIWTGILWKTAIVIDSSDQDLVTVSPDEIKPRKFLRHGSNLRPHGYVEPDSDDEDSSTP